LEDPIEEGPSKGNVTRLAEMLPEYYALRGWSEDGIPTDDRKEKLGL
jgi:aldehyde:ferredoxin oxidoreductase